MKLKPQDLPAAAALVSIMAAGYAFYIPDFVAASGWTTPAWVPTERHPGWALFFVLTFGLCAHVTVRLRAADARRAATRRERRPPDGRP